MEPPRPATSSPGSTGPSSSRSVPGQPGSSRSRRSRSSPSSSPLRPGMLSSAGDRPGSAPGRPNPRLLRPRRHPCGALLRPHPPRDVEKPRHRPRHALPLPGLSSDARHGVYALKYAGLDGAGVREALRTLFWLAVIDLPLIFVVLQTLAGIQASFDKIRRAGFVTHGELKRDLGSVTPPHP